MKTYTHPTIIMPCGSVIVVFKDPSKTGTVTLDKCIVNIGDVEEGFDYNLGDYIAPSCSIKFTNASNSLLTDMLDTYTLEVEITINNEGYFIGDLVFESIKPDMLYEDSSNLIGEFTAEFLGRLARLEKYSLSNLDSDISTIADPNTAECTYGLIFQKLAAKLGLKSAVKSDIDYLTHRKYKWWNTGDPGSPLYLMSLDYVAIEKNFLDTDAGNNYYGARLTNTYELLGEMAREFFFFPTIYKSGSDWILRITEKDYERTITLDPIKKTSPTRKHVLNKLLVQLNNMPDGFTTTDLIFQSSRSFNNLGDDLDLYMHHTNIDRSDGAYITNQQIRVDIDTGGSNTYLPLAIVNNYPSPVQYDGLQEAIYNAYKNLYYDKYKWREVTVYGLKATYSGNNKMEYLVPAMRFSLFGQTHYIHTVQKSLMKNESKLTCLIVS